MVDLPFPMECDQFPSRQVRIPRAKQLSAFLLPYPTKTIEVILDRAPRDEIRKISTRAVISISTPLFTRSSRWGTYIDVRTYTYVRCSYHGTYINVRTVPVRTTVVTSYQVILDRAPRDEIREISTRADISISTPLFTRSSRWGTYIDVRNYSRMYAVVTTVHTSMYVPYPYVRL